MDDDTLRDHLARLHQELGRASLDDPRSRQLLVDIMGDITRLTGGTAPAAGASGMAERLENAAVQFEAGHPGVAASIRRFVDLLGKAGL
jgi:hypothetical protein